MPIAPAPRSDTFPLVPPHVREHCSRNKCATRGIENCKSTALIYRAQAREPAILVDERRSTDQAEARVLQIERIKSTSRRLMADKGAPGLSLREVAREMGVVSSALYRYFPTRDDLLTALIVDAYNDLGEFAERAVPRVPRERTTTATARRRLGDPQVGQGQSQ